MRTDPKGNKFIIEQEPKYGNWKVYEHLAGEEYRRLIGEVDTANRVMFVKRDKSRHYHYMMKAYGFNYIVIKDIEDLKYILLMEKDGDHRTYYMLPIEFIRQHANIKQFSAVGFELQYFLRHEYLERFKTNNRFEKGRIAIH